MVMPEEVAARILSDAVYNRTSLRAAAEKFFGEHPDLDYMKPIVRVLTLNVARNYMLIDRALQQLGYGPPSHAYRWMLARVLAYEVFLGRKYKRSRLEKLAPKAGIAFEDLLKLQDTTPRDVVKDLSGIERVSVLYSFPRWILEELLEAGVPDTPRLLEALNRDPVRWIRIAPGVNRERLRESLAAQGVLIEFDPVLPDAALILKGAERATKTREYSEGLYTLQDKASMLVSHLATPRAKTCGDVTAGAAVKASHLAWLGARYVVAGDVKVSRLYEAKRLINRLHVGHLVDVYAADARRTPLRGLDVVIVDPPCTDVGRLQYEPEVKMWITRGDLRFFQRLQYQILRRVAEWARPGTRIVYSVCTLTASETLKVVRRVLREVPELEEEEPRLQVGEKVKGLPSAQRLYPHKHLCQGFFIAVLRKV